MYGSAALLHRGIYASVRIRASRELSRSAAAGAASPEVVTVLPGARCRCDDERRTLPGRRRCCREDCVHDGALDVRSTRDPTPFCAGGGGVPIDATRTRSLIVVTRPGCPECHTVRLGEKNEQLRNYGTVTTTA